jgi:hypothetical protein
VHRRARRAELLEVPRTFRSKKSYAFLSPRSSWMPCQAAIWTMQSQPRNMPVSFDRSGTDPSTNSAPFFKSRGARTSRMTGVSPLSSSLGMRVWTRFPDPPVRSTFIAGCNLTCKFCQNWDISKAREIDRLNDRADPTAIVAAAVRLGCRSVAVGRMFSRRGTLAGPKPGPDEKMPSADTDGSRTAYTLHAATLRDVLAF